MDDLRIWVVGASEICYLGIHQALGIEHKTSEVYPLAANTVAGPLEGQSPYDIYILSACQLGKKLMPLCMEIHAEAPKAPILIWSQDNHLDPGDIFKAGASGYLCSCSVMELSRAIEALRQGYQYCDTVNYLSSCSKESDPGSNKLTKRQEQIQMLAAMGFSDKEIANKLSISPHTVRSHLRAIFEITGVRRRTRLAPLNASQLAETD